MLQGSYFEAQPDAQPYLHCWSLSVEEQFYLFFPIALFLVHRFVRQHMAVIIGGLCAVSLVSCVILTATKPNYAFYLLPTRAWEMGVGCLLAALVQTKLGVEQAKHGWFLPTAGLLTVLLSFVFIEESKKFPGFVAVVPVLGAAALLVPSSGNRVHALLSAKPLTAIGKGSYSLYLWHWPIFALIDYRWALAPEGERAVWKIALSAGAAVISYCFIETPFRQRLNREGSRKLAFGLAAITAIAAAWGGVAIRKAYYVDPDREDLRRGGVVFGGDRTNGSVVLMGDSNGAMYGRTLRAICRDQGLKFTTITVNNSDPLPTLGKRVNALWQDMMKAVRNERPTCVVMANLWGNQLEHDPGRLALAVDYVLEYAERVVLLTQAPTPPREANRAGMRAGGRPPFFEHPNAHKRRASANAIVASMESSRVLVIDVAPLFLGSDGEVITLDARGAQLFHDSIHLSGIGAERIRPPLEAALANRRSEDNKAR